MRDRQHQIERPKYPLPTKCGVTFIYSDWWLPIVHGALMRDRQRQLDRPKTERLSVTDNKRRLCSSSEIGGCPIVHGALMRDSPCQPHSLILKHWCTALMRGKVCAEYKFRINFDLDDTTKCIYT